MTILILFLIGRFLFSMIFIFTGITQLLKFNETVKYMSSLKVPFPTLSTLGSSIMALAGGGGIIYHSYCLYGAIAIILFLVPSTYFGHKFWSAPNKKEKNNQMQHFMKNIALTGGAIIIAVASLYIK
ncbi:DoxX family protein [Desulfosporosinus sp. SYSU MS00001]|uniref:DoxX family protein n=1 Tax=Desulfosporosinus sp. SYSU MS00001 TaxID=3416284 RepID=UPI003CED0C12